MTFSFVWIVLAATVTMLAMLRRAGASSQGEARVLQSGKALTVVAIIYSLVLVAGFLYVGWQHTLDLLR
jgi:hypothetical protein